jgi:tyrosine aminotransferase
VLCLVLGAGLAKEFIVPGWRVGWLSILDRSTSSPKTLGGVKAGLKSLSQLILGACSLVQRAVPRILTPAPGSEDEASLQQFNATYMHLIRSNAEICLQEAAKVPELTAVPAKGAMYVMIRVEIERLEGFTDDTDFCARLLMEENVFVLPGQCFGMPN